MASRRTPRPASEYSFEHSQASHVSDDGALTNAEDLLHGPRLGPSVDAFILQRHRSRLERSSRPTTPVTPQVEISPPEAAEEPVVAPATAPNAARASKSLPSVVGAIRSRGTNVVDIDSDSDSDADSIMGEAETDATLKAYLLKPRRQSFDAANTSSAGTGPGSRLRKAVFLAIEKERAKRDSESHEYRGLDWDFLTKWQKSHLAGKNGAPGSTFTGSNSGSSTLSPDETASEKDVSLGVPFRAKPKFQRRPGLPGPRFVLHAPGLQYPRTSTTFSFTPEQLQSFPWFWIDILNVMDSEMFMFSRVFSLHPLTAEDIIEGRVRSCGVGQAGSEGREKLEVYPAYYFVLLRALEAPEDPLDEAEEVHGTNLNVIVGTPKTNLNGDVVGPQWILTFHSRPLPVIAQVYSRLSSFEGFGMATGTHWLTYALLDAVVDSFSPQVQTTDFEAAAIEDLVNSLSKQSQDQVLRRITASKKRVMGLSRLLSGKPSAIKHIRRRLVPFYTDLGISELGLYLSDVGDNVVGLLSSLQYQEQTLVRAHGTYLARVQIEIQEISNASNNITNKLTILASIIVPLNLILGLWSVNVKVPWQTSDSYYPFMGFCLLCVILILATVAFARWRGLF